MTRTIYIVFQNHDGNSFSLKSKEYAFLCNYDGINLGDTIVDPRYDKPMFVTKISNNVNRYQNGLLVKDIHITEINGKPIEKKDDRNLKVSLEEAREWYNSDNEILRKLALTVYTEKELTFNLEYIKSKVIESDFYACVPASEINKYKTLMDLAMVAKYFNGAWKKTPSNTGYFLGQSSQGFTYSSTKIKGLNKNIGICEHNTVIYPGIVYFKEKEDLIKAVEILGDKVKDLFK